jgi:hypothetical protein
VQVRFIQAEAKYISFAPPILSVTTRRGSLFPAHDHEQEKMMGIAARVPVAHSLESPTEITRAAPLVTH